MYFRQLFEKFWKKMKDISNDIRYDYGLTVSKKFYDNLKHLFFMNKISGLFPISVTRIEDHYRLQWSWLKVLLGNFCVIIYATITLTGLSLSYKIEEVYNVRVKDLAALMSTLAEIISLLSTWFIGQISTALSFKQFWKYLYFLTEFDAIMGTIEPTRKTPLVFFLVFLFTFTCLAMDIYMWAQIVVPIVGYYSFLWKIVPFYFTYIFTMILEVNVWTTLYNISSRIKRLNTVVESYVNISTDIEINNKNERFNDCGYHGNLIKIANGPKKTMRQFKMLTSSIVKDFIRAFNNITQANMALTKFLGPSMIILLLNVISCLVITPYVLYQQILNAKKNYFLFTQSYWMTCHVLRLLLLIEPCHTGQIQGTELKKSIVKMATLDLSKDTYKQVKILLLMVTENNIEFNASGMTFINRTLLPTIGSAVFTYLAILFQYKNNI